MAERKVQRIHPEYKPEEKVLAQYNLFTGEAEAIPVLIDEHLEDEVAENLRRQG